MRPAPVAGLLLLVAIATRAASAQASPRLAPPLAPRWELRLGAPLSPSAGALAGAGLGVRAGWYARIGIGATAGVVRRGDGWQARQHLDLTARFLLDPYGERPIGLYGGAGLGLGAEGGVSSRGELLLLLGVEGAARGRVVPALEVIVGGGVRVQGVLRARRETGR